MRNKMKKRHFICIVLILVAALSWRWRNVCRDIEYSMNSTNHCVNHSFPEFKRNISVCAGSFLMGFHLIWVIVPQFLFLILIRIYLAFTILVKNTWMEQEISLVHMSMKTLLILAYWGKVVNLIRHHGFIADQKQNLSRECVKNKYYLKQR